MDERVSHTAAAAVCNSLKQTTTVVFLQSEAKVFLTEQSYLEANDYAAMFSRPRMSADGDETFNVKQQSSTSVVLTNPVF